MLLKTFVLWPYIWFNSGCIQSPKKEVLYCIYSQESVYVTNLQMNVHKQLLIERQHASYFGSKTIRDTINWQPQSISAGLFNLKQATQTLGDNLAPTTNPQQTVIFCDLQQQWITNMFIFLFQCNSYLLAQKNFNCIVSNIFSSVFVWSNNFKSVSLNN